MPSVDAILEELSKVAKPGDTIALLSNGAFGGIYSKLLKLL
jgi:UDP-N-acetylmuramate: L-alanyl-gamma-D-glutamyl-meso-diaminopimelate ligase